MMNPGTRPELPDWRTKVVRPRRVRLARENEQQGHLRRPSPTRGRNWGIQSSLEHPPKWQLANGNVGGEAPPTSTYVSAAFMAGVSIEKCALTTFPSLIVQIWTSGRSNGFPVATT